MKSGKEQHEERDLVATLIRSAGWRGQPPPGSRERVLAAVEAKWNASLRRRRLWRAGSAVAATFLVAATAVGLLRMGPFQDTAAIVAHVDRIAGPVETRPAGAGAWLQAVEAAHQPVYAGTRMRTGGTGTAGLLLTSGVSLRLASASAIELQDANRLRLVHGAMYVDTGPDGRGGTVEVVTTAGTVLDMGTQFELKLDDAQLRVRVREGQVVLRRDDGDIVTQAGGQLTMGRDGKVSRSSIDPADPSWQWAERIAPAPETDGRTAASLLAWVARETGRDLRYLDEDAEKAAGVTILHGRISGLTPLQTLDVLLATTTLEYGLGSDGSITIGQAQ